MSWTVNQLSLDLLLANLEHKRTVVKIIMLAILSQLFATCNVIKIAYDAPPEAQPLVYFEMFHEFSIVFSSFFNF